METKILENSIENLLTMFGNENGYKIAQNIDLDGIKKQSEIEKLKNWSFEMACTIINVHYQLYKIKEFIEFYKQNEEVK